MTDEQGPVTLVTTRPDAEIAADLKARANEALKPIFELMAEAATHKLLIRWDTIVCDQFGLWSVVNLRLERHY